MATIAQDLDTRLKVEEVGKPSENRNTRNRTRSWKVTMPDGSTADIRTNRNGKTVHIDASRLEKGESQGSLLYQLVGQWAANNDKVFIGDPAGITAAGKARRLEHLISLSLKFGTTDHFMPHPDQNIPWKVGDHSYNLTQLLMASSKALHAAVPQLKGISYDFARRRFVAKSGNGGGQGSQSGGVDFQVLANTPRARNASAGAGTLKRGVLIDSLVHGAGSKAWRKILGELVQQSAIDVSGRPSGAKEALDSNLAPARMGLGSPFQAPFYGVSKLPFIASENP